MRRWNSQFSASARETIRDVQLKALVDSSESEGEIEMGRETGSTRGPAREDTRSLLLTVLHADPYISVGNY